MSRTAEIIEFISRRSWLSWAITFFTGIALLFTLINVWSVWISSQIGDSLTVDKGHWDLEYEMKIDSLELVLAELRSVRIDTTTSITFGDRAMSDSLVSLARQVRLISSAISPKNVTEIITLQRLGDRCQQLTEDIENLKVESIRNAELYERMLNEHAQNVRSELDRFIPIIWGVLATIVGVVISSFWTSRTKAKEDQTG